jgi:hypothetical protein
MTRTFSPWVGEVVGKVQLRVEVRIGLRHAHFDRAALDHLEDLGPVAENAA